MTARRQVRKQHRELGHQPCCKRGHERGHERGAAGIEMGIAVTGFLLATFLVVGGLRITTAKGEVAAAARAGARAAAQSYEISAATTAAHQVANDALGDRGIACRDLDVRVEGSFTAGSVVTTTVSCQVDLGDVVLVGFGRQTTVQATAAELTDVIRGGG